MGARQLSGDAGRRRPVESGTVPSAHPHDPITETWRDRKVCNAAAVAALLGVSVRTWISYRTRPERFETPPPSPVRYVVSGDWNGVPREVTLTHPDTGQPMWDRGEVVRWDRTRPGRGWRAARTS